MVGEHPKLSPNDGGLGAKLIRLLKLSMICNQNGRKVATNDLERREQEHRD